jgi:multiple sugar transport system substrate-binding protein
MPWSVHRSFPAFLRRLVRRATPATATVVVSCIAAISACTRERTGNANQITLTIAGSAVGAEGRVLAAQVARFEQLAPGIRVRIQRAPDDATQRHQLFVQWLNAHVGQPDVLQLDVIWTPEFAAAGWILPLSRWRPDVADFFPGVIAADRWRDTLYALPWWTDAGMLYWRTDLLPHAPATMAELADAAAHGRSAGGAIDGLVWQGARYEGLVTVFVEFLGAFGGRIMDDSGRVVVDAPPAVAALSFMRDLVQRGLVPRAAMTWHEEEARLAFQSGRAVLMRNWPYAYTLMSDSSTSRVAGRYAAAPMPAAPGGAPSAALGGQQLAINAYTAHADAAYRLVAYLTAPAQMLERARIAGSFPPRRSLYDDPSLDTALGIPSASARAVLEHATPRPVTPIYSQLSELLQIQLHRALTGQAAPADALTEAARAMEALVERTRVRTLAAGTAAR